MFLFRRFYISHDVTEHICFFPPPLLIIPWSCRIKDQTSDKLIISMQNFQHQTYTLPSVCLYPPFLKDNSAKYHSYGICMVFRSNIIYPGVFPLAPNLLWHQNILFFGRTVFSTNNYCLYLFRHAACRFLKKISIHRRDTSRHI